MQYNQEFSTTTSICLVETSSGDCGGWEQTSITTYKWADTLALFLIPIFIIWIISKIAK